MKYKNILIVITVLGVLVIGKLVFLQKKGQNQRTPANQLVNKNSLTPQNSAGKNTFSPNRPNQIQIQSAIANHLNSTSFSPPIDSLKTDLIEINNQIRETQICLDQQNCDFKDTDPRQYEFAVFNKLNHELNLFKEKLKQQDNPKSVEIQKLAQLLIIMENGEIKEQALDLMAQQNPDPKNVEFVVKEILFYHDSNLVEKGLAELTRYLGQDHENEIQLAIFQNLSTGSLLVREKISEKITPFLTKANIPKYQDFIAQTPTNSKVRKNLKSALDEWTIKQEGG